MCIRRRVARLPICVYALRRVSSLSVFHVSDVVNFPIIFKRHRPITDKAERRRDREFSVILTITV